MLTAALFFKECVKTFKSIPYLMFLLILIIFVTTQLLPGFHILEQPQPGQQSYGTKYVQDPEIIMPSALKSLYGEFLANSYTAYPVGFYKNVKLNDTKQTEMAALLAELTGLSRNLMQAAGSKETGSTLQIDGDAAGNMVGNEDGSYQIDVPDGQEDKKGNEIAAITYDAVNNNVTYKDFLTFMDQADKIIGGGSKYSEQNLFRFGAVPMTFEDALTEYNKIMEKDQITGAYARLFSDYLGIMLGICPVFVAVALGLKDRSSRIQELIYSRKVSSVRLVFIRYAAMIAIMLLPLLLMALCFTVLAANNYRGMEIDILAYLKYTFGWLLPTLMVSTATGVIFTELTDSAIAVIVQGLWWFFGLFSGMRMTEGGYGWNLVPRHNILGNTQVYLDNFNMLMVNRIAYTVLAVVLILLTALVYEMKRRGRFYRYERIREIFSHRRQKPEV
jgi:hypothetical protein